MKKTIGLAAILAVTATTAFAGGFQFSIDGGTARIDFDENCTDRLCASVSYQERGSRERREFRLPEISTKTISKFIEDTPKPRWNASPADDDDDSSANEPSQSSRNRRDAARDEPAPRHRAEREEADPAPRAERDEPPPARRAEREPQSEREPPAPAPRASAPAAAQEPSADTAPGREPAAERSAEREPAPERSAEREPAPERSRVASVAPRSTPESAARPSRPSPVGEWLVEDRDGKIRIEECGANMCGYVSAAKNANEKDRHNPDPSLRNRSVIGTPILINMKPDGKRWSGQIYNVKDGRSYTAHISLKNPDTLRVEGCAFGGMICGGQNWSRVD